MIPSFSNEINAPKLYVSGHPCLQVHQISPVYFYFWMPEERLHYGYNTMQPSRVHEPVLLYSYLTKLISISSLCQSYESVVTVIELGTNTI